jgi:hypothetical protein
LEKQNLLQKDVERFLAAFEEYRSVKLRSVALLSTNARKGKRKNAFDSRLTI